MQPVFLMRLRDVWACVRGEGIVKAREHLPPPHYHAVSSYELTEGILGDRKKRRIFPTHQAWATMTF